MNEFLEENYKFKQSNERVTRDNWNDQARRKVQKQEMEKISISSLTIKADAGFTFVVERIYSTGLQRNPEREENRKKGERRKGEHGGTRRGEKRNKEGETDRESMGTKGARRLKRKYEITKENCSNSKKGHEG